MAPICRTSLFAAAGLLSVVVAGCSGSSARSYQGYVEGEFLYLASSQPGRLEHLAATRGQQVGQGTLLFTLEATEEKAAQQQAQEQLAAAEAQHADLETGKRAPEVAVVRAQLAQAQAAAQKSALQRERDEAQYRAGGISREQLEATLAQARSDAAHVSELESQLQVARLPGRAQQLKAQSRQVQAARAVLEQADWKVGEKSIAAPRAGLVYDTLFLLPMNRRRSRRNVEGDSALQSVARAGRLRALVSLVRAAFAIDRLFQFIPFGPGLLLVARKLE